MKRKITVILNILFLFLLFNILVGCVGDLTAKNTDASDETLIWDVYMEYTKWCNVKDIEPMAYAEWETVKEEMKENPDAIQQEIARADSVSEETVQEQTSREATAEEETLVFETPEEEAAYIKVKEFYDSLSELEKEYLKGIIEEDAITMQS